jgi:hypothetical protein
MMTADDQHMYNAARMIDISSVDDLTQFFAPLLLSALGIGLLTMGSTGESNN